MGRTFLAARLRFYGVCTNQHQFAKLIEARQLEERTDVAG